MPCMGVDIGGTKTHLRLSDGGRVLGEKIVSSSSWRQRQWQADAAGLIRLVNELVGECASGKNISALAIGAHGCDDAHQCAAFQAALQTLVDYPVCVVNDSELIPVAQGVSDGIGLVAGTGSIAVGRGEADEMLVAGGWGWMIGDEGSAAGLVREASRLACQHLDCGLLLDDPLMSCLQESFAIEGELTPAHIGHAVYKSGSAANLGRHAPALFAAAEQGSVLARQILAEGAQALVMLVERLVGRGVRAHHVVAAGGVITNQPEYGQMFLHYFDQRFGARMQAHILIQPPVTGACIMAEKVLSKNGSI